MATLPISKRDMVTPYNIAAIESAELVVTSSNKAAVSRRGGFAFSFTMGIRPYNLLSDSDNNRYWSIVSELSRSPYLFVPVYNIIETNTFKNGVTSSGVVTGAIVGNDEIVVALTSDSVQIRAGQFVKFNNKDKLYQVASHSGGRVKFTKPLSHTVTSSDTLVFSEIHRAGATVNELFDGVHGYFVNEDFGNSVNQIEDGILGKIGPLQFMEKL